MGGFAIGLCIVVFVVLYAQLDQLKKQQKIMQRQLDELWKQTNASAFEPCEVDAATLEILKSLKAEGKEVEAVKKLRELTDVDLVSAKQYIDKL